MNENRNLKKKDSTKFETLVSSKEIFNKIIIHKKNFTFENLENKRNINWSDIFYNESNNNENLSYKNKNNLLLKSKKLTRSKVSEFFYSTKAI